MRKQKGFTLIELLVVIAIIGILAAIVLVSLSGARDRAKDARIQSGLSQVRTMAEMVYNADDLDYSALCDAGNGLNDAHGTYGDELDALASDITSQSAAPTCYANANDEFCVSAPLASDSTVYVCVDETGQVVDDASGPCTAAGGTGGTCSGL